MLMILSDMRIMQEMEKGTIKIDPYDPACLGSNSYDLHLWVVLSCYNDDVIDAKKDNPVTECLIPEEWIVLHPWKLYLWATLEYTETLAHVPFLEGKSSTWRLGIDIHATAWKWDVGFRWYWPVEISVAIPVRVYAGMPIGQMIYFPVEWDIKTSYDQKSNAKYSDQIARPVWSKMRMNTFPTEKIAEQLRTQRDQFENNA